MCAVMALSPPKSASRAPLVPDYVSPEVAPDGRVTIRYYHPAAKTVWCEGEWNDWEPIEMRRDARGLWSCTTDGLAPDIYEYGLFADGARVIDYQNLAAKDRFTSFVEVPGRAVYEARLGPHGTTHVHWYHSAVTGTARRMQVYTPPGYETEGAARRYPVLYLLHGRGDDDEGWVRTGRVNFILDNLVAEGRARPMVVAMPDGHVLGRDWKERRETKLRVFAADFYEYVMPEVERLYRVGKEPGDRAMAGLSMGGGQTISTGMTRPGMFGGFGLFSSGLWPEVTPLLDKALPQLREKPPEVLWVGIGRRDILYEHCALLRRTLEGAEVPFIYHEDDTTHCWRAWRDYLERFAPLLFRGS
jgi:enterochelin esterase family protein